MGLPRDIIPHLTFPQEYSLPILKIALTAVGAATMYRSGPGPPAEAYDNGNISSIRLADPEGDSPRFPPFPICLSYSQFGNAFPSVDIPWACQSRRPVDDRSTSRISAIRSEFTSHAWDNSGFTTSHPPVRPPSSTGRTLNVRPLLSSPWLAPRRSPSPISSSNARRLDLRTDRTRTG